MPERSPFIDQLRAKWDEGKFVCVGLDADYSKIPQHLAGNLRAQGATNFNIRSDSTYNFLEAIVDSTADLVCAFKPNIGFFEDQHRAELALQDIVYYIHHRYPDIPVIGDVKRGDVTGTMPGYGRMAFERYNFDAATLNNQYFGGDTLKPLQIDKYKNRGLIVMSKTSNPGSAEVQDLTVDLDADKEEGKVTEDEFKEIRLILGRNPKVYEMVAYFTRKRWDKHGNMGVVVGATYPEAFTTVRKLVGDRLILIPGIGNQAGDLEKTIKLSPDSKGQGVIINSAGSIIFASDGEDFAEAARAKTLTLHSQITELRAA